MQQTIAGPALHVMRRSCHVMLVCLQGVKDKEVIAVELAAAEAHIGNTAFGQMLLRRYVPHNLRSSIELSTYSLYSSF